MKKKIIVPMIAGSLIVSSLFGCAKQSESTDTKETSAQTSADKEQEETQEITAEDEDAQRILVSGDGKDEAEDGVTVLKSTSENTVYLKDSKAESKVSGVTVDEGTVTITKAGTYILTGTLKDGQIVVDAEDEGTVKLVFWNVDISSGDNAPVYVKNASQTLIVLAEDSENTLSDAAEYTYEDEENEEPNACLFSKDDLVLTGAGTLNVNANYNNGIQSKDSLIITGGCINIKSENDAIKAKDGILITDGEITIETNGDGIQSKGTLTISGGNYDITSGTGAGEVKNTSQPEFGTGWDRDNSSTADTEDETSVKGIKAESALSISGGTFTLDTEDDALHSNGTINITGGTYVIKTGDDGIHADDTLVIEDGEIAISQSYEGIESPDLIVNDGVIHVTASDDGFNAAGGEVDSSSVQNQPGGMMSSSTGTITINDGYIYVNASGDGLDSNGDLTINGGVTIVEGPTSDGNTAVDYDGSFNINGGFLLAGGSAGMVEQVSTSSTQNSVTAYFTTAVSTGENFAVVDKEGNVIAVFEPSKTMQCFILSTPDLETGSSYNILTGGSCDGTFEDGLCTEGTYSGGTQAESFEISSVVTTAGIAANSGMGGGPGGNRMNMTPPDGSDMTPPDGNGGQMGQNGQMAKPGEKQSENEA